MSNLATYSARYNYETNNWGADPSATPGTSVTPGASGAEGSWINVLGALAHSIYLLYVRVSDGATSAAAKQHVMDIGVDPAGGSSYTEIISNIVCGASATITAGGAPGHEFLFPYYIPAGSTVAVRISGSNATAGTVRVGVSARGERSHAWVLPSAQYSETLGVSGTSGTSFTPGNAAAGSWVLLGTTTRECWWWQLAYQINNATITAEYTYIELAWGDATNKHIILRRMHGGNTSEGIGTPLNENLIWPAAYCVVPASTNIYVRGRCNNAPDSGYQASAIGLA